MTFGKSIDFYGNVFIAADAATLFPGKKFEVKLAARSRDSDSEAVRTTLRFTDVSPSGLALKSDADDLMFGNFTHSSPG